MGCKIYWWPTIVSKFCKSDPQKYTKMKRNIYGVYDLLECTIQLAGVTPMTGPVRVRGDCPE